MENRQTVCHIRKETEGKTRMNTMQPEGTQMTKVTQLKAVT